MSVLLLVLSVIAVYLATGWRWVAPGYVTREVERQVREYPALAPTPRYVEQWRREAASEAIFIVMIWPFYLIMNSLTTRMAARAPLTRHEHEQKTADLHRRIAQLESQLGMPDSERWARGLRYRDLPPS